jgi:nucleoside 2-deoxyribosyltransferase
VVRPVSEDLGFFAFRADDVFRPGVILQDIIQGIVGSDVVLAEITPVNANVFYELGYAHALNKPTILLANRNTEKLPFDISGYRVIFYDDSIRGKRDVEATLRKHLESVRRGLGTA